MMKKRARLLFVEWSWRYVPIGFFSKSDCLKAALLYLTEIVVFVILGGL